MILKGNTFTVRLLDIVKNRWRSILLLIIMLITVGLWFFETQSSAWAKISLEYDPTGTMQYMAQLEYQVNGNSKTIVEEVKDFSVQFTLGDNITDVDKLVLGLGDQSGTVRLKQIIVETKYHREIIEAAKIPERFWVENAYSTHLTENSFEIFTYDISYTKFEMDMNSCESYMISGEMLIWHYFAIIATIVWIILLIVERYYIQIKGVVKKTVDKTRVVARLRIVGRLRSVERWKILILLLFALIGIVIFVYETRNLNGTSLTIEYGTTGTQQYKSQLEYIENGKTHVLTEPVENFKVTFSLDKRLSEYDKIVLHPGDESGTLLLQEIVIETQHDKMNLKGEEILNSFSICSVYSCEQIGDMLNIFTYDITQTSLQMDMSKASYLEGGEPMFETWQYYTVFSMSLWIVIIWISNHLQYVNELLQCARKKISAINKENAICCVVISLLLCIVFSEIVSDIVYDNLTRYANVKVACEYLYNEEGISPLILDNYCTEKDKLISEKKYAFWNIKQLNKAVVELNNVEYVSEENSDSGYGYFKMFEKDSYIVFRMPVYPNTCLTLSSNNNKYAVTISNEINSNKRIIAYENSIDVQQITYYPFEMHDYMYLFVSYTFVYIVLFGIICFLLVIAKKILGLLYIRKNLFDCYNPKAMFWIIFALYFIFTAVTYYFNQTQLKIGPETDAFYYMYPDIYDGNGRFSLAITADYLYSFRGYFTIVVAVLAELFETITGVQMIYFYFIYYGVLVAFTISVAMPLMYKYFTNKQVTNTMCFITYALFFVFWRNTFYYAMGDIPAAMCAICALAYALNYLQDSKYRSMFVAGLFMGIAISYRTAYTYLFYFVLLWVVGCELYKVKNGKIKIINIVLGVASMLVALYGVAIPQFVINYTRGHIGFFPYDGGWKYDVHSAENIPLAWSSFTNGFLRYGLYPPEYMDAQLTNVFSPYYENKILYAGDLLYIVLTNPLQFLMAYFKRLFYAMSAGVEGMYGTIYMSKAVTNLVRMLNYTLLGNYAYIFSRTKDKSILSLKGKWFCFFFALCTIFIQNLSHIERRYYLCYFMFIYFLNGFVLLGYLKERRGEENTIRYLLNMLIFIFGCFMLYMTIHDNFL